MSSGKTSGPRRGNSPLQDACHCQRARYTPLPGSNPRQTGVYEMTYAERLAAYGTAIHRFTQAVRSLLAMSPVPDSYRVPILAPETSPEH